jgi:hypothetical protein
MLGKKDNIDNEILSGPTLEPYNTLMALPLNHWQASRFIKIVD